MISEAETGGRSSDVDLRALAIGQGVVFVVFVITWVTTRFDDTSGRSPGDAATVAAVAASLPAFVTGLIAGLAASSRPKIRRGLLIGFALFAALGAGALYAFAAPRCQSVELILPPRCPGSWKDAVGIFLGAEFGIAFQAVVAWLFAGIGRKYPLRRPAP